MPQPGAPVVVMYSTTETKMALLGFALIDAPHLLMVGVRDSQRHTERAADIIYFYAFVLQC